MKNLTLLSLNKKIADLHLLVFQLKQAFSFFEKIKILDRLPLVQKFLKNSLFLSSALPHLKEDFEYAFKSVIAIGEGPTVFNLKKMETKELKSFIKLLKSLSQLEAFYHQEGGLIGYQLISLQLIRNQKINSFKSPYKQIYLHPPGLILEKSQIKDQKLVRLGLQSLPQMGEIYPLGGAGERLNLINEKTGAPLPVAKLSFLGRSLLEGMIRDLQAREYLYYKLFKKQITVPVVFMTSLEKNNHQYIKEICRNHHWFGRGNENFYFITQPQVPVLTEQGHWSLTAPLDVTFKPGGHGVLWKLAEEKGAFSWFESKQRLACLIRQINNPLAGTDQALLALTGYGIQKKKSFGFLSCERLLNSAEGTNILIETKKEENYCYCLTNIEYPEFDQKGIKETPKKINSPYSVYPANTNILFANFSALRQALKKCSIPGQLINMKSKVPFVDLKGKLTSVKGGRLESTMQNIADALIDCFNQPLPIKTLQNKLKTFLLYNPRNKTISTTKHLYKEGISPLSTPEQAYYDLLANNHHLFETSCHFKLPSWTDFDLYLKDGPSTLILFHPALGPCYQVIEQKIQRGSFSKGSELQLEIAEILIEQLNLEGSLLIQSFFPLGQKKKKDQLSYGKESRCILKNVIIRNQGIDNHLSSNYWKNQLHRKESVQILLEEGAEFYAENVVLEGSHVFKVPPYYCLTLIPLSDGKWKEIKYPLSFPSWQWNYFFGAEDAICLKFSDKNLKTLTKKMERLF